MTTPVELKVKMTTGKDYTIILEFLKGCKINEGDRLEIHPTLKEGFNIFIIRKEEPVDESKTQNKGRAT